MFLKPLHGLQKSILFGILGNTVVGIASNGETMLNAGVEVDLVRLLQILEDLFRFVALLGREDLICLGSGDGKRAFDVFELVRADETWVCNVTHIDFAGVGAQMKDDVLAAEAIADSANSLFAVLASKSRSLLSIGVPSIPSPCTWSSVR